LKTCKFCGSTEALIYYRIGGNWICDACDHEDGFIGEADEEGVGLSE